MRKAADLANLPRCESCTKPQAICICDRLAIEDTKTKLLVLRHPQEEDVVLGTASILERMLKTVRVSTGLSWHGLEDAWDRGVSVHGEAPARDILDRKRWAVLYPPKMDAEWFARLQSRVLLIEGKEGSEPRVPNEKSIDGFIVIDGTWTQAKTIWWRNAWLLKLPKIALLPKEASMYGKLRQEPRSEWVSTLEASADVLEALGESSEVRANLRRALRTLLQRTRDQLNASKLDPGKQV